MGKRFNKFDYIFVSATSLLPLVYFSPLVEPSVFPKLVVATTAMLILAPQTASVLRKSIGAHTLVKLILVLFALCIVLACISTFSSDDLFTAFFGIASRYNGFLGFHFALIFILIGYSLFKYELLDLLLWLFSIIAFVQCILGIAQQNGFVLIKASNPYSPIVGTFGNPNYLSAFLGFGAICTFYLIFIESKLFQRFLLVINLTLIIFVIYISDSIQGIFMFAVALVLFGFNLIRSRQNSLYLAAYFSLILPVAILGVLGLLNRGPLKVYLFQESTFYRFDYWRAALKMMQDKWMLGVGPDQFSYSYIFYRDKQSTLRNSNVVTDSAHNMYLQAGATYGIPYLIVFCLLILVIAFPISLSTLKTINERHFYLSSSAQGLFLAFLVQALISVDTVTALVPGFIFGGFLLALRCPPVQKVVYFDRRGKQNRNAFSVVAIRLTLVFLGFFSLAPMANQLFFASNVRDHFSAPGTSLSLAETQKSLRIAQTIGNGDRSLWILLATYRYQAQDISNTKFLLDEIYRLFPNYPVVFDYKAQLARNSNDFSGALAIRQKLLEIDKFNIANIRELILISKDLNSRDLYETYLRMGREINPTYFSSPDLVWN